MKLQGNRFRGAALSEDRVHRYLLWRIWGPRPWVGWIMLNPSDADHDIDDPTIRDICARTQTLGYAGVVVANAYSYRSPYPTDMFRAEARGVDITGGRENDRAIRAVARRCHAVVAGWGRWCPDERAREVVDVVTSTGATLCALGLTQDGAPKHPLARGHPGARSPPGARCGIARPGATGRRDGRHATGRRRRAWPRRRSSCRHRMPRDTQPMPWRAP